MNKLQMIQKINNHENSDMMFNLYERYQDEKEYEDIAEYLVFIQKSIPEAQKIFKRPFGVEIKCSDGTIRFEVIKKSSSKIGIRIRY